MKKLFFSVVFFSFCSVYAQINFLPYTLNGSSVTQITFTGTNTYYVSMNGNLLKTTDYFHTFDTLYRGGAYYFLVDAYGLSGRIILKPSLISTDDGETWNSFSGTYSMYAFAGEKIFGLNSNSTTLAVSSDNGTSWNQIALPSYYAPGTTELNYNYLGADNANKVYVARRHRFYDAFWEDYLINLDLFCSGNGGSNWTNPAYVSGTGFLLWNVSSFEDKIFMSVAGKNSRIYNTTTSTSYTLNQWGNAGLVDKQNTIFHLQDGGPPTQNKLLISSDWQNWVSYSNDFLYMKRKLLVDEYGYIYCGQEGPSYRTEKPYYNYLSIDSLNFGTVPVYDTLLQEITVYNPLYRPLPLDSITMTNSNFFVKGFVPATIASHDSLKVIIGFSPQGIDSSDNRADIYLDKLHLKIKLFGVAEGTYTPVELISFAALSSGNSALLKWSTSSEKNNKGFAIERREDSSIWKEISFVAGSGTSTEQHDYSFTDKDLTPAVYEYRLKQTDFDGKVTYSKAVRVEITLPNIFALMQNYPNPFNPSTTINYQIPSRSFVSLKVMNILGQEVTTLVNDIKEAGTYSVEYSNKSSPSGVYFYRLQAGEFTSTRKMILAK